MHKKDENKKGLMAFVVVACAVILGIAFLPDAMSTFNIIYNACTPIILGLVLAYIVNIPMSFFEKHFPDKKNRLPQWLKTTVCMLLAIVLICLGIGVVISIIVPELENSITMLIKNIPALVKQLTENPRMEGVLSPDMTSQLQGINWEDIMNSIGKYLQGGLSSVLDGSLGFISSLTSYVFTGIFGIIFSIYFLTGKKKLVGQSQRLLRTFLPEKVDRLVEKAAMTANDCFSSYFVGRFADALIMGVLCAIGMTIFGFKYAAMISILVGFTGLVPIVGAYVGAFLGFVIMLTVSPRDAVMFLIYIIILQQLEGNIIYPKVVGATVGLPGIWVLASVTVFSALSGFMGIILGVPFVATIYRLLQMKIRERDAELEKNDGEISEKEKLD